MEFTNSEEIRLLVDELDSPPPSSLCLCRICHEEEEQVSTSMESPCACSGTVKFAHRGCIQRWCDEKGSTVCEICFKNFEPGYTVAVPSPAMPQIIHAVITIRGSLEAAGLNHELQNHAMAVVTSNLPELEHAECSPASNTGESCFQSVALMFTIMFLVRHLFIVLLVGSDHYSSTLSFIFLLRVVCILLPLYLILRLVSVLRNAKRQQQLYEREVSSIYEESEDDIEVLQHAI